MSESGLFHPSIEDERDADPSPVEERLTPPAAEHQEVFGVRLLMLGWCMWLMGTWIVLYYTTGWTAPAFRIMVLSAMLGFMGVWPAIRLSQATPGTSETSPHSSRTWRREATRILIDWLFLNLVFQAVMWPLQMAGRWTLEQTLWVDAAVAGWSLLAGLVIAWGRGGGTGSRRTLAMIGCVGIVLAEPVLMWAIGKTGWDMTSSMRLSPIEAIWGLTSPLARSGVLPWAQQVAAVGLAAVTGWVVLYALLGLQERGAKTKLP